MAIELRLPDMGEGTEDVTISRWLVSDGDVVAEGDVVLEVATDKVDTEVTAPASGTLIQRNFGEGELAPVGAVLGLIGAEGEAVEAAPSTQDGPPAAAPATESQGQEASIASSNDEGLKASPVAKRVAAEQGIALTEIAGSGPGGRITKEDVLAVRGQADGEGQPALPDDLADVPSTPVRRLAAEHNINLADVAAGRPLSALTKYDLLSAIASRDAGETVVVAPRFVPPAAGSTTAPPSPTTAAPARQTPTPTASPAPAELSDGEELIPHTRMRAAIARNTMQSLFSAPHVTTMWDLNMAAVLAHRSAHKKEFAAEGVNLTVTAYLVQAIIAGLRAVPAANASWSDDGVIIKRYYNIGMAVALPMDGTGLGGLIVPVIKNAGDLNLMGIARAVNELAQKARNNQLRSEDLQGGTFTLSNYGTSGSRFQTPVIVSPQVGILGVGAIEKRAVVVSQGHPLEANTGDHLAFLPMTTLGFSYDHRVLDGATADAFCAAVKDALEKWE